MLRREIVSGSTAVYLALLVLLCPLRWLIAGGVAAVVHELGHSLAVRCCGGKLSGFRLSIFGAYLNAAHLSTVQEILCILAGPLSGLVLLVFIRIFPRLAICGALQSLYNLLPIYPLDGGRLLRCSFLLMGVTERTCRRVESGVSILLILVGIYGTVILGVGGLPLLAAVLLVLKAHGEKLLAMRGHLRYNNIIE